MTKRYRPESAKRWVLRVAISSLEHVVSLYVKNTRGESKRVR